MNKTRSKLLFIVGPTATGKTALALHLAQQFHGEIISADSRQVYKGMDIGTGKDLPTEAISENTPLGTRHQALGTSLFGIDQVQPNQDWSVSQFSSMAQAVIHQCWNNQTLPVVVGGTGLYAKSLTAPFATMHIPQNLSLRAALASKTVEELRHMLNKVDPQRLSAMNMSDRQNPRRLIRAIEVAKHPHQPAVNQVQIRSLWIGLTLPFAELKRCIHERVVKRFEQGMEQEVQRLMRDFPDWSAPAFSALGYRETCAYLAGKINKHQLIEIWTTKELQYAKRQMVWFKKQPQIQWFAAHDVAEQTHIEKCVKDWYDTIYAAH